MQDKINISIFYCGGDTIPYLYGLVSGLRRVSNLTIDVLDSDQSIGVFDEFTNVKFFNIRGNTSSDVSFYQKIVRIIKSYLKLLKYVTLTDSKIFHIQWFNRFQLIDATLVAWYYRLLGKKLIYTAHNINARERNNTDNTLNRVTLKFFYNFVDHIIVHNKKSRKELKDKFSINGDKVSVIKIGLNIAIPRKNISADEGKEILQIPSGKKTLLFFGGIDTYKGLDVLLKSFSALTRDSNEFYLLIAGKSRNEKYILELKRFLSENLSPDTYRFNLGFIPDESVESYFMAADCLILPYRAISQSGVHVLSYSFGLPVIATDVGSFKDEDVVLGKTGFVCTPEDPEDLKLKILEYFNSSIYRNLEQSRTEIKQWANDMYSWENIADKTAEIYKMFYKKK